jgi:hypothetical protein
MLDNLDLEVRARKQGERNFIPAPGFLFLIASGSFHHLWDDDHVVALGGCIFQCEFHG